MTVVPQRHIVVTGRWAAAGSGDGTGDGGFPPAVREVLAAAATAGDTTGYVVGVAGGRAVVTTVSLAGGV